MNSKVITQKKKKKIKIHMLQSLTQTYWAYWIHIVEFWTSMLDSFDLAVIVLFKNLRGGELKNCWDLFNTTFFDRLQTQISTCPGFEPKVLIATRLSI